MREDERDALSRQLATALSGRSRDAALDALRAAFLEDEMAIPEISFDFGLGGYDDLSPAGLYEALSREPETKLRRLAKLLGVAYESSP